MIFACVVVGFTDSRRDAGEFGPYLVAAYGHGVAVAQSGTTAPPHRLTAAVDVGPATAINQAEATVQVTHLGMAGDSAGTVRRKLPAVAGRGADGTATGSEAMFNAGATTGFRRVGDH